MDPAVPESASDFYETPNLERLAREGMTFSNAYAPASVCSPSRVSILTGKSPAQVHMTDAIPKIGRVASSDRDWISPESRRNIDTADVTIAEWIKAADPRYRTAFFGKWHVKGGGPGEHGFDRVERPRHDDPSNPNDPKQIDVITYGATDFMREQVQAGRPFFVQLAHHAVHWPIRSRPETLEHFQAKPRGRRHKHPGYAAMTADLDAGIGRLLDSIEELGITDRTWIFYVSDNGASDDPNAEANLPLAGGKASLFEGGIRVPMFVRGPGVGPGTRSAVPVIGYDLLPTIAELVASDVALPDGVEGGSLLPLLKGGGSGSVLRPREGLVFHFPHHRHDRNSGLQSAIRVGRYKLIRFYSTETVRLFDLSKDLAEKTDLSELLPERTRKLSAQLHVHLEAIGARLPVRNRRRPTKASPGLDRTD
jgi:arylsulfatase A-like enzyme